MDKRWYIRPPGDEKIVASLMQALNVDKTVASLLVQRGITTFEEAKTFFRPALENLHDPFLMKDMDKAVQRIEQAIGKEEKILVYGDYDVDGSTAVTLVYLFLKNFYPHVDYYIPDRYAEGYGISFKGIDYASENGFSLIIALDCGIKSLDKVSYATEKKIDFIICDHHLPGEKLPAAVAVLDPKRNDCPYPYKELCGCGVGFKLVQAFCIKNKVPFDVLEQYMDLTAISIAADIVPITGENRILAHFGLKQINANPRRGIKAILELANVKRELTISDLVFIIAPRINAAGRLETARNAVELLISETDVLAKVSGLKINITNNERKTLDVNITQQALGMIDNNQELIRRKSTVLFHSEWHKGVIGIVASRLTEKYYRPTIVLTESNGKATGSARSVKNFDIHAAIEACSDLLEQFGGHRFAAGLTLSLDNVDAFTKRFEEVVSSSISENDLIPEIEIDEKISFSDITPKFYRILQQFAPFGPGNMSPMFMSEEICDRGYAKLVGTNHLKMDVFHPSDVSKSFSTIAFGQGEKYDRITKGRTFSICYTIEENTWNGNVSLQLNVKDIK